MRTLSILLLLSLVYAPYVKGEEGDSLWSVIFGGNDFDSFESLIKTDDGNYVAAGLTESFGSGEWDMLLVKMNASGIVLWSKSYGGPDLDAAFSVIQTIDGGYLLTGFTESFGIANRDLWIVKTDSLGDSLWSHTYGDSGMDWGSSASQSADGGFMIVGTRAPMFSPSDIWMIKTNSGGDTLWTKTFGSQQYADFCHRIIETSDGNYLLSGNIAGMMSLIKTDPNGNEIWQRSFVSATQFTTAESVIETQDGGYVAAGRNLAALGQYSAIWIIKTTAGGDSDWVKCYTGDQEYQSAFDVTQLSNGNLLIVGSRGNSLNDLDGLVMETDSSGDSLWLDTFGGHYAEEYFHAVLTANDGNYWVAGATGTYGLGSRDGWLLCLEGYTSATQPSPLPSPSSFTLHPPSPNPFNATTAISYQLQAPSHVSLKVFDTAGRLMATLIEGQRPAGMHEVTFDGSGLASGLYLARLTAGGFTATQKLVLLK
jgi:hypothetical protein